MFSKQAIDWLERLFNTAFTRAEKLPDALKIPGPTIETATVRVEGSVSYLDIAGRDFGTEPAPVAIGAAKPRSADMTSANAIRVRLEPTEVDQAQLSVVVIRSDGVASTPMKVALSSDGEPQDRDSA